MTEWNVRHEPRAIENPWAVGFVLLIAVFVAIVVRSVGAEAQRRYEPVTFQFDVVSKRIAIPESVSDAAWICAPGREPMFCQRVGWMREMTRQGIR
ncbi:MAG: hypothetical protein ABI634_12875 [Acidobacteriota bacterium]